MIILSLPIPVSTNSAYANAKFGDEGGRVLTKQCKEWKRAAKWALMESNALREYRDIVNENLAARNSKISFRSHRPQINVHGIGKEFNRHYSVLYKFHFPDDAVRDIANFEKLVTDFLCDHGFMLDDQFIDDMRLMRGYISPENPRVEIMIKTIDNEDPVY